MTFVDELSRGGVDAVCLAPGSRSAPLAMAFARHPAFRVYVHLDERCASFFALGMARVTGRPVALLCTSGTAAAEFHAAVVEADLSRVPLLVLTADRPPELREVGANQVIDQARLYGPAVRWYFDPGPPADLGDGGRAWRRLAGRAIASSLADPPGPVHLNVPLREPLVGPPGPAPQPLPAAAPPVRAVAPTREPAAADADRLAARVREARRPLVVAGELSRECPGAELDAFARAAGAPVLAEPSSQLRREGGVGVVDAPDALLRARRWAADHRPDLVLRLGATPTSREINAFLAESGAPVLDVDPGGGWRDPDLLAEEFWRCAPGPLLAEVAGRLPARDDGGWRDAWVAAGRRAADALTAALVEQPLHEGHVVRALAGVLPAPATVVVGSSLPIRDVDAFWPPAPAGLRFLGNRGASGIDGLVSTGLGAGLEAAERSVLLLGDLSLYHDMNGLWAVRRHGLRPLLVVLDNDGGGIFHQLPQVGHQDVFEELFGTPLGLRLEDVAQLYGLAFSLVTEPAELPGALREALATEEPALVCARFPRDRSRAGHQACWQAVAAALDPASR